MSRLKKQVQDKIEAWRPRTTRLLKEFGNVKVDEVDISQVIGGARDIKSLITDISYLDPFEGIRFRGIYNSGSSGKTSQSSRWRNALC